MNQKKIRLVATLMCFLLFLAGPMPSHAQIWKNLGKKLEQKIENEASRRAERKIDQAINKGLDGIENAADGAVKPGKSDQATGGFNIGSLMGAMGEDVQLKDRYDFQLGVTYEVHSTKGNQTKKETDMTMWFSDAAHFGVQMTDGKEPVFTVMDDGKTIMFMEGQKSYVAVGPGMLEAMGSAAEEQVDAAGGDGGNYSITQLGDETILGYRCKVYQFKGADSESRVWITDQLDGKTMGNFVKSLGPLVKRANSKIPAQAGELSGVMMKVETVDTHSKEVITMEAKTINKDGIAIQSNEFKNMRGS